MVIRGLNQGMILNRGTIKVTEASTGFQSPPKLLINNDIFAF